MILVLLRFMVSKSTVDVGVVNIVYYSCYMFATKHSLVYILSHTLL